MKLEFTGSQSLVQLGPQLVDTRVDFAVSSIV